MKKEPTIYEKCLEFSIKKGWTDPDKQIQKVHAECLEVFNAENKEELADELGDMLFAMNPIILEHLNTTHEALLQRALDKNKIRETNPNYKR